MKNQFSLMVALLLAGSSSFAAAGGGNIGSSDTTATTKIACNLMDARPGADETKNGPLPEIVVSSTTRSRIKLAPGVILNNMPVQTIDADPLPSGNGHLMIEIYEDVGGRWIGPMMIEGSQELVSVSLLTSTNPKQRVGVECSVVK